MPEPSPLLFPGATTFPGDVNLPSIEILTHPDPITAEVIGTFTFVSPDEPAATFEVSVDGGPWTAAVSPFVADSLGEGWHIFKARATDVEGNTSAPAVFGWHVRSVVGVSASERVVASTIPKLRVPLRLENGRLGICGQDSQENVAACVYAVLAYERGSRLEDPEFGIEDPTFGTMPIDVDEWMEQIAAYEPRAEVSTEQEVGDLIGAVLVEVGLGS